MNNRLKALWLVETIRLTEQQSGSFSDEDANRQAKAITGELTDRLIVRAQILAKQNGLEKVQNNWLYATRIAFIIVVFLAVIIGSSLAFTALSQEPVNIFWALVSLLGIHFITLFIWLLSTLFLPNDSGSLFMQLWFWLTKKLVSKQTTQQLFPALVSLINPQLRWLIGFIVNALWCVILASALIILLILLSTKHYSFVWQTTLLNADTFISLTLWLGKIPSLFGFSIPDVETIRQSGELAIPFGEVRSMWAIWLVGIFVIYGLFVRFFLMMLCGIGCLYTKNKSVLNLNLPEYQVLAQQLQPFQSSIGIIDADNSLSRYHHSLSRENLNGQKCGLVAIDIDEQWNPPEDIHFLGVLNSREQRKRVLDYLQQFPTERLLIAIDSDRVPDRGMLNLILELSSKSTQTAVWLINTGKQYQNWQAQLSSSQLPLHTPSWLMESDHD